MKRTPFLTRFLMPDTGAPGGGGGSSTPAAPPAAPTPPAAPFNAPPATTNEPPADTRTDAQKELDDFVPAPFEDDDTPAPKPGEPPAAPKDDKKQTPAATPPPAKPGDQKKPDALPDNAPAAKVRERLNEVVKERDEWKKKAETPDPRIATLEAENAALKTDREKLTKDYEAKNQELAMHDPVSSEAVRKLEREYDEKFERATQFMPELQQAIQPLVTEFAALKKGDPAKYSAGLKEFRQKVADIVGPENAAAALGLIADGLDFITKREAAVKDVRENGAKFHQTGQKKSYDEGVSSTRSNLAQAVTLPEGFETAQPFHPMTFVTRTLGTLDETQKAIHKGWEAKVDEYITFADNGLNPEALASLNQLPPNEREARKQKIEADRKAAKGYTQARAKQAILYDRFLPALLADYARLLEADKKRASGQPPDPNNTNQPPAGGSNEDIGDDIQKYKPAAVPNF